MAISPARCWGQARSPGPVLHFLGKPDEAMEHLLRVNAGLCYRTGSIPPASKPYQAINKGVWRETKLVPLDPTTAQPAKNSPRRKEKHLGKTSLPGRCVGPCHRGGKQRATHSESEVFGQNPLDLTSKRGSSHQAQARKSLVVSVLSAWDSLSGVDREKSTNKGMQTILLQQNMSRDQLQIQ